MNTNKGSVVIIDDDRDFTLSTKIYLEGRGYSVKTAGNGAEGWEKIGEGKTDLIILDIMMDYDAEGFNLAYKLRQNPSTQKIPIIIVSGFSQHLQEKMDKFQFVLGQDWPADDYLEKPVELKVLADKVGSMLGAGSRAVQANI